MKTNLDLHLSAAAAAQASVAIKSQFQADVSAQQTFAAQKLNELDWPQWKNYFDERRKTYSQLAAQVPPSVIAEQRKNARLVLPTSPAQIVAPPGTTMTPPAPKPITPSLQNS